MMVKSYARCSEKNMRMSRDLEGTEVLPVIWGELLTWWANFRIIDGTIGLPSEQRFRFSDEKIVRKSNHVWRA
ncbi:unnamed protein product [Staurois parvus]|uniref:Uncharacterized protein n=1 Tax=Staurois parvus TaxID=386267 RepID=A0ABN9FGA0_9NEOB|nr:unnamed protein product [Staurois parvus]